MKFLVNWFNTIFNSAVGLTILGAIVWTVQYYDRLEQREKERQQSLEEDYIQWQWVYVGAFPGEDYSKNYRTQHRWRE